MAMIGILIFPDFQLLDASGPASVFEIARRLVSTAPNVKMIAAQPGPVRSSCGVEVVASSLTSAKPITTLVVAGGLGVEAAIDCRTTLAFVRRNAARGVRVASVCSGAYVLAAAGLLDGRKATTHWCRTQDFVSRYPKVRLDPDRIFLRDGNVWTSAGITAGIDLALAIAAEEIFVNIARYAYAPREGEATIEIDVSGDPPVAVLRFLDRGTPFNPLEKKDPDVTLSAEDREAGGLGVFMAKKIADTIHYAHEADHNVLTLTKALA